MRQTLTVLFYLNGVGETWFPLALREAEDAASLGGANPPRHAALAAARQLTPGKDGLRVAPRRGDAVAFYNHVDEGGPPAVDRLALHAGLPAPAAKEVAALWFHCDLQANEGLRPLAVGLGKQAKAYEQRR